MRHPTRLMPIYDESRWILAEGHRVHLVYLMNGCATKPYVSMLAAPSGRNFLADCPSDHIHHHGIWWGHGDVNGVTFYLELPSENPGHIFHRRWVEQVADSRHAGFVQDLEWVAPSGDTLIEETRTLRVTFGNPNGYSLDLESVYTANTNLTFGDTKESALPLIRIADAFNGRSGGVIVNSEGARGEQATFGQSARWVDYHAPVPTGYDIPSTGSGDGVSLSREPREGLACFDHPNNPDYPNKWFTRDYGPLSPREGHHFVGGGTLAKGESLRFRHRIFVHEGDEVGGGVESAYAEFASS